MCLVLCASVSLWFLISFNSFTASQTTPTRGASVMRPIWCLLLSLAIVPAARAQTLNRRNLEAILGFENNTRTGVFPLGWGGNQPDIFTDDQVVHSGKYSARIERGASSPGTFTTLTVAIPLDFSARTIEWRGFLKWENVN